MEEGLRAYRTSHSDVTQPGRSTGWMERCQKLGGVVE